ncbi:hypothetical protein JCM10207_000494 [Rhodosporidiobolus poonsookiae]
MSTTTPRLLVRGSINVDEFFTLEHIVRAGETISSTAYSRRAGGKGANQSVAAAKAGAAVDFAGLVGTDGTWLKDTLGEYGVGLSLLSVDEENPTGRAIIQLSSSDGDNSIVLFPGANFSSHSPLSSLPPSGLSRYTHLLLQNEIPLDQTKSALRAAHATGLTTVFNPSPMLSVSDLAAFEWDVLDWLLINAGEAEDLVRALSPAGDKKADGLTPEECLSELRRLRLGSLEGIIMTRGADGVVASMKTGELVSADAGKVVGGVVDTTGAGDCFTGYFATLLSTLPRPSSSTPLLTPTLQSILSVSCQAAAMCCESHGAMESVPVLSAVKERMGASWPAELL